VSEQVPSHGEVVRAADWLGKHGVRVRSPTLLLATRLGVRGGARTRVLLVRLAVLVPIAIVCAAGYQCLQYLPGVRGVEMTESKIVYFIFFGFQGATWLAFRRRDRQAAAVLGTRALDRPRPPWREPVDGWYLAAAVVTFAGGAALALGAVVFAVIASGVLRRPVIAEDEPSLAVDAVLRAEDLNIVSPSLYAFPVLLDLVTTNRQPPGFTPWLACYAGLVIALQAVGGFHRRGRPALPEGRYGEPLPDREDVR
jgi:hypothetical protein